jgi:glycosyltransferase involved in cell wall biosynthesis
VNKDFPEANLFWVGRGCLVGWLRARATGLPIEFPGWQDTRAYLAEADAVLSTSPAESWGASIVEALAAGVPVVALDVGVAREAGASIATPDTLAPKVAEALEKGERGELTLRMPSREEYATLWRTTLLP